MKISHQPGALSSAGSTVRNLFAAFALLSAGQAHAVLTNSFIDCEGSGTAVCVNPSGLALDTLFPMLDVNSGDSIFVITVQEDSITLSFPEPVTGAKMDTAGFHLIGLQTSPLSNIEISGVTFIDFLDEPIVAPEIPAKLLLVPEVGRIDTF